MSTHVSWNSQTYSAGSATRYDVVRGPLGALRSDNGFGAASCFANDWPGNSVFDSDPDPASGDGFYYLVRAANRCGTATYGNSSLGTDPRDALESAVPCP